MKFVLGRGEVVAAASVKSDGGERGVSFGVVLRIRVGGTRNNDRMEVGEG